MVGQRIRSRQYVEEVVISSWVLARQRLYSDVAVGIDIDWRRLRPWID